MKRSIRLALAGFLAVVSVQQVRAADQSTELAKPGKQLFADAFARTEMAPKWRVGKGFFTVKDGVVNIAENPDDHHGAYAYVAPGFPYKDIVAEFQVKLDGARSCSLMINDRNYKESHAGHILKATLLPGKVNLADWKYGAMKNDIYEKMKDPKTTAEEKKQIRESIKNKSADFKTDADLSQWHTVRVDVVGDEMLASIDGKPAAYLKSQGVDHPTKNAIGFEVGGKSVELKDFKVFEATPDKAWAEHREAVVESLKK
ncbi:MAG TPA: family 16 glycoside hydrolase [Tepidisphaeraceae bacterium]|nr:family 16 glycoside hydrolase [Tepidisphaeraceae bacterium]